MCLTLAPNSIGLELPWSLLQRSMSPPPKSEVLLMSSGSAFAFASRFGLKSALKRLEAMPPPPNHSDVLRFTKPPNENA